LEAIRNKEVFSLALTKLTTTLNKISTLANRIRGQAATVKAAFDYDVNVVKTFINETLTAEIDVLDAANVKKTGNQTIAGVKTFSSSPVVPAPTNSTDATNKTYIDTNFTTKSEITTNRKLSATGDFTGSWHGITNPVYADPGIANVLAAHMADYAEKKREWINVVGYGIDNTGVTDVGAALNTLLDGYNEAVIYFPKGIYKTSISILVGKKLTLILDPFAIIRASAAMDSVIKYGYGITTGNFGADSILYQSIDGGIIDCNNLADNGIEFGNCFNIEFKNTYIFNVLEKGVKVSASDTFGSSNCIRAKHITIRNFSAVAGCYGVYDNGSDSTFENIMCIDVETAIYTSGLNSNFKSCHGWISIQSLIPTSTYAEVHGDTAIFDNPRIDTLRYGFKLYGVHTTINNAFMLFNLTVFTSDYSAYQPCFINCMNEVIWEYVICTSAQLICNAAYLTLKIIGHASTLNRFVGTSLRTGGAGAFDKSNFTDYQDYFDLTSGVISSSTMTIHADSYVRKNNKRAELYLIGTSISGNTDWVTAAAFSIAPTKTINVIAHSLTNNGVAFKGTINTSGQLALLHSFTVGEQFLLKAEYDIA
jgi:hypothetical protein